MPEYAGNSLGLRLPVRGRSCAEDVARTGNRSATSGAARTWRGHSVVTAPSTRSGARRMQRSRRRTKETKAGAIRCHQPVSFRCSVMVIVRACWLWSPQVLGSTMRGLAVPRPWPTPAAVQTGAGRSTLTKQRRQFLAAPTTSAGSRRNGEQRKSPGPEGDRTDGAERMQLRQPDRLIEGRLCSGQRAGAGAALPTYVAKIFSGCLRRFGVPAVGVRYHGSMGRARRST